MAVRADLQFRLLVGADRDGQSAARVEGAATGHVDGRGRIAAENDTAPGALREWVRSGRSRHQGGGVGVPVLSRDSLSAAHLDNRAEVHDGDPVAHRLDHAEVVGDEQVRHAELALQVTQERENLRTGRDVEPGHGLVAEDEARPGDQGTRNHDPLALSAGQRPGQAVHHFGLEPDATEDLDDLLSAVRPRSSSR